MRQWKGLSFFLIMWSLILIDRILGWLIFQDILPPWIYVIANMPFGLVRIWTENQWVNGHFLIQGKPVNELLFYLSNLLANFAQAVLYNILWLRWRKKTSQTQRAGAPYRGPAHHRTDLRGFVLILAVLTLFAGDLALYFLVGTIVLVFLLVNIPLKAEFA